MNLERLLRADIVAGVAALALLFVMATDWYSTNIGNEARRIEQLSEPQGGAGGQLERENREDARLAAEQEERNAWQESGTIDRAILLGLLATVILALASAVLRAAGRRFEPPGTPTTATAMAATLTALLVAYRTIQEPGFDEATTIESGAPLAIIVLAVIALACRSAMEAEADGSAWLEPEAAPDPVPAAQSDHT